MRSQSTARCFAPFAAFVELALLFAAFALFATASLAQQAGWYVQYRFDNQADIRKIVYRNETSGMLVADGLYVTTNGGETWTKIDQTILGLTVVANVTVMNDSTWLVNTGFDITLSTNDGMSWVKKRATQVDERNHLTCAFTDTLSGICFGGNLLVHFTSSRGSEWRNVTMPSFKESKNWYLMRHDTLKNLLAVGYDNGKHIGAYASSNDSGATWTVSTDSLTAFDAPYILNDSVMFLTGRGSGESFIMRSSNAGMQWSKVDTSQHNAIRSIDFYNETVGYAVGDKGLVLRTDDGGLSWKRETSNTDVDLFSVEVISPTVATASGQGIVVRTSGSTSVYENVGMATSARGDWSAYPVPATNHLTIKGSRSLAGKFTIALIGVGTGEVHMHTNVVSRSETSAVVEFDTSALPTGSYVIVIEGGAGRDKLFIQVVR